MMLTERDRYYIERGEELGELWDGMFRSEGAIGRASNVSKGWGRYTGGDDRRYDVAGPDGTVHLLTEQGFRTWVTVKPLVVASTLAYADSTSKVSTISELAGVSKATVSRWLQRFMAWGWLGYISVRGRYGGVLIFARKVGDGLDHYAREASTKIRKAWERARCRAWATMMALREFNVSHKTLTGSEVVIEDRSTLRQRVSHFTSMYGETLKARWDAERAERTECLIDALGFDRSRTQGRARCPAHGEGRKLTLSWKLTQDRLLIHCFAGCTYDDIVKAVL